MIEKLIFLYSSELSSYSDKMMDITAYEQSFVYPHAVSAITLTSTKFGITSKDVIGMTFYRESTCYFG